MVCELSMGIELQHAAYDKPDEECHCGGFSCTASIHDLFSKHLLSVTCVRDASWPATKPREKLNAYHGLSSNNVSLPIPQELVFI
jgi:hypothetical protein